MSEKKVLSKKVIIAVIAVSVVLVASIIIGFCLNNKATNNAVLNVAENDEYRDFETPTEEQLSNGKLNICLITKTYNNSYWDILIQGCIDAANDMDVNLYTAGIAKESNTDRLAELMEHALQMEPDAIIVSPADTSKIIDVCKRINEKDIPLIFVDTILNGQQFDVCFMTDNMQAGRMVAIDMVDKLRELGYTQDDKLSIGIDIGTKQSQTIIERLAGFNEYWSSNAPVNWRVIDTIKCNDGSADVAYEQCLEFIDENADLAGLIGLNNGSTVGLSRGLVERERKDIALVGFDYSNEMASLIEGGEYNVSTMVQLQYNMGYGSVTEAINICNGIMPKYKFNNTGVMKVNHENYNNPYIVVNALRK